MILAPPVDIMCSVSTASCPKVLMWPCIFTYFFPLFLNTAIHRMHDDELLMHLFLISTILIVFSHASILADVTIILACISLA